MTAPIGTLRYVVYSELAHLGNEPDLATQVVYDPEMMSFVTITPSDMAWQSVRERDAACEARIRQALIELGWTPPKDQS